MGALLSVGSSGFEVARVQLQLNKKNAATPPLSVDGAFGPMTRAAVVSYQSRSGLKPDGIVGDATRAALDGETSISGASHSLKHIAQPTDTTCWAASTAMMTRSTVVAVRAKTPASMIASDGGLLNSSETDQAVVTGSAYGSIHGLRCFAPMSWTVTALFNMLQRSPLMVDMLWNTSNYAKGSGSPGHMVVASAIVTDSDASGRETYLLILDPWKPLVGKRYWVQYASWMQELPTRTYRVFSLK